MTRKDYKIIAEAIAELYKDEIQENRATLQTTKVMSVISKHLNSAYSNFNPIMFANYAEKKAGIRGTDI